MANHKSAIKRIRSSEVKKQRNRYQHKSARTAMKKFFEITKKKEAEKELPSLTSMIDKLAKNNIIHDNKAANFCLLYTSPSPRDATLSRMPSSA